MYPDRNEMMSVIESVNPSVASKLNSLMEKKEDLIKKGNVYGESFSERSFWLSVDPVIKNEYKRSRILQLIADESKSVKEIATEIGLVEKNVLQQITALLKKNLIKVDKIEGTSPKYQAIIKEES
jgi:DNA-binding NarL/FixJ family response regulator